MNGRAAVCRENERSEFAEAKDRLKHSWAADREDFARVKDALKKKNADHHVQNGRLSQSLKVGRQPYTSVASIATVAAEVDTMVASMAWVASFTDSVAR